MVVHVHGAVGVGDESDGYAEAWYLPAANNIPAGYATEGTWYDFFEGKAAANFGVTWGPGFATFQYPNINRASTIWYHDHTLGMTRLNVYAGPAGFYIIRGGPAGDDAVLDYPAFGSYRPCCRARRPRRTTSSLPTRPTTRSRSPSRTAPSTPMDRSSTRTRACSSTASFPTTSLTGEFSPIWNPEFFGNMIMVNGNTWPFQTVEQRRYRFRFLNGCNSRFLILDFSTFPAWKVWQIGNEGGFLAAPVNLTATNGNRLLMGSGRARRRDRGLHQRAGGQLRARQRRPRRAVRRRSAGC